MCAACRAELPYLPAGVCRRCASLRSARGVCRGCRRLSPALSTLRVPFAYEGAARTAVLNLKFRSGRYLVPLMGEFLRRELEGSEGFSFVICPRSVEQNKVVVGKVVGCMFKQKNSR